MVQPLWKMIWQFLNKLNTELAYDPAIQLLGVYRKEVKMCTNKILYINVHISSSWKPPKCLTDEWINNVLHLYNGISVMNMNEVLLHSTMWIALEHIVLSERIQTQNPYFVIPFIWNLQIDKSIETMQISGLQGTMGRDCLVGPGFLFRVMNKFWN